MHQLLDIVRLLEDQVTHPHVSICPKWEKQQRSLNPSTSVARQEPRPPRSRTDPSREQESRTLLAQDALHDVSMNIRQPEVATLKTIGQPGVVDAQLMQNRGLQIVDVNGIANNVVRVVVRFAMDCSRLDPAPRHPQ